jgi:hypothetical protein
LPQAMSIYVCRTDEWVLLIENCLARSFYINHFH